MGMYMDGINKEIAKVRFGIDLEIFEDGAIKADIRCEGDKNLCQGLTTALKVFLRWVEFTARYVRNFVVKPIE